ncbi:MAG: glutathione S-transferase family protein [Janthinobacterium lividum]
MIVLHHDAAVADTVKLRIALAETGTAYHARHVDTAGFAHWADAHRRIAPQGQVPVLVVAGEPLADPALALQYIAEAAGSLAPPAACDWYAVQSLNARIDALLGPAVALLGWQATRSVEARADYRRRLAEVPGRERRGGWSAVLEDAEAGDDHLAAARERVVEAVDELEARLDPRHDGTEWLVGDAFSIADINAFALLRGVPSLLPDAISATRTPRLAAWFARVAARPAVALALGRDTPPAYPPPG